MVKYTLKYFSPYGLMYRNYFVCPCIRTVNSTYAIFNTTHAVSDLNDTHRFHDILIIFTEDRARKQINRVHKCISILLESIKNDR